jgi:hypothetical protein
VVDEVRGMCICAMAGIYGDPGAVSIGGRLGVGGRAREDGTVEDIAEADVVASTVESSDKFDISVRIGNALTPASPGVPV